MFDFISHIKLIAALILETVITLVKGATSLKTLSAQIRKTLKSVCLRCQEVAIQSHNYWLVGWSSFKIEA
jgi:hypothetical protein